MIFSIIKAKANKRQKTPKISVIAALYTVALLIGPNINAPTPRNIEATAMSINNPYIKLQKKRLRALGPSLCLAFTATSLRIAGSSRAPFLLS